MRALACHLSVHTIRGYRSDHPLIRAAARAQATDDYVVLGPAAIAALDDHLTNTPHEPLLDLLLDAIETDRSTGDNPPADP